VAAQKNRTQRRSAKAKHSQARTAQRQRAGETVWQRRARRRRVIVFGAVGVLVLALVGGVAALVATSGGQAKSPGRPPTVLTGHTLLHLTSASSVAEGDGTGYVTDDTRDVVEKFDPATGKVEATTKVPGRPVAVLLVGPDLWLADMVTNTVVEVDAASLSIVRSIPVPAGPTGLAVLGNDVWVSSVTGKALTPIDTTTGVAGKPVSVLAGAVRVAGGFGALWVTGTTDLVTRIVPASNGGPPAQTPIKVGRVPLGVTTGAGHVWVANSASATVDSIEPSTLTVSVFENIGSDPVAVAVAAQRVWVGFGTSQTVRYIVETPESEVLALGSTPRALIGVGAGVWVATSNAGAVVHVTAPHAPPVTH
jgi:streptogramin lyase